MPGPGGPGMGGGHRGGPRGGMGGPPRGGMGGHRPPPPPPYRGGRHYRGGCCGCAMPVIAVIGAAIAALAMLIL